MPFYKYVIHSTKTTRKNKDIPHVLESKRDYDDTAVSNQRIVNALRHLSQLIRIADDIFSAIEIECRSVFERTTQLSIKIHQCQVIVDSLNAKAVKVPVSSFTGSQITWQPLKSCDIQNSVNLSIFSRIPRPASVDYLRELADGPSPLPCGMVASEVDSFTGTISSSDSSSTHIYCKPIKIKDICKSRSNIESMGINGRNKNIASTVKVPSSVVAIDVSGQPFSRMSSFRRSLIHVDFLLRKKKKDKRRNTVAEGDVKELKDALESIVNDECQISVPNTKSSYQQIITDSRQSCNSQVLENQKNLKFSEEQNNNAAHPNAGQNSNFINEAESQIILENKTKCINLSNDPIKHEPKVKDSESTSKQSPNKRKTKSHIPISTISAAMNVAVEMRQCNGIKAEIPIVNGIVKKSSYYNSNSDAKMRDTNRNSTSSVNEEDILQDDNWENYKKRLREKCIKFTSCRKYVNDDSTSKETEVSSSTSSENIDPQDSLTTEETSADSDTFFISSDESEDLSYSANCQDNCGSSTSLGTASDGSLNSLLSETGTEMSSSTGTLISVGRDHILTPPPPPPPMILSATINDKKMTDKIPGLARCSYDSYIGKREKKKVESVNKKGMKQVKFPKSTKPLKADLFDVQNNATENSKNIFSNLMKANSKGKSKSKKEVECKKLNKISHQPAFDMYGSNSPSMIKQMPAFFKETTSPVVQNEEKSHMKSFSVNDNLKHTRATDDEKFNNPNIISNKHSSYNNSSTNCSDNKKADQIINNIPSKYEHQVIVTPVHRNRTLRLKNMNTTKPQINQHHIKCSNTARFSITHAEPQILATAAHRTQPPFTLQQDRSKLAARVVLDFDGKVIYSTNSLDRKNYNIDHTQNADIVVRHKLIEPHFEHQQIINENNCCNLHLQNHVQQSPQVYTTNFSTHLSYNSSAVPSYENTKFYSSNVNYDQAHYSSPEMQHCATNDSYASNQICEQGINTNIQYAQSYASDKMQNLVPKMTNSRPCSFVGHLSDIYVRNAQNNSFKPDPNISGLPVQETRLTKHNVNLHSKQMENMSISRSEDSFNSSASDSFFLSPVSQREGNILNKSPQSTMSTEDLFAVIHNCKKRMNIKTDTDISVASSSSRSSSPSYIRPSSSKGTLAETGFLSPRNQAHLETSGDRRSWADFRPVDSINSERKSLASDRLGPTKPTSMHDFKMLLLQTRSSQIPGPRKSAVEMLKIPLNQDHKSTIKTLPLNLSPRNSMPISLQNSPSSELNLYNGHSTVPFKRGNRVRTSLQSKYIMYPPIFEDCSEDLENCTDISSNKSSTATDSENVKIKQ